jgi:hypothetical protein
MGESLGIFSRLQSQPDNMKFTYQRIFMFEAHNVIRESLEHRCVHLVPRPEGAFLTELSLSAEETDPRVQIHNEIQHLHDIARAKCEQLTRRIVDIVKMHINTSFFEWDASLVRGQ